MLKLYKSFEDLYEDWLPQDLQFEWQGTWYSLAYLDSTQVSLQQEGSKEEQMATGHQFPYHEENPPTVYPNLFELIHKEKLKDGRTIAETLCDLLNIPRTKLPISPEKSPQLKITFHTQEDEQKYLLEQRKKDAEQTQILLNEIEEMKKKGEW